MSLFDLSFVSISRKPAASATKRPGSFCVVCQTCSFESASTTKIVGLNEAGFHAIEHQSPHDIRLFQSSHVPGGIKRLLRIRMVCEWAEVLHWDDWRFAGSTNSGRAA